MPSLGLTGELGLDDILNADDQITPRKRDRGERIVWTPEEDNSLRTAVQIYGDKTEKWAKIAACVPGRTNKNCRKRWFHSLDPSLKKGAWTDEEDHLLRTGVDKFKGQWSKIAERIPGRTDDQCAKRWRESLDPHIDRAAWTPEDDEVLLQRFHEYGSQWQKIALAFPGRPGLHCRNRWRKLQRSSNHVKRASKRSVLSETRKLKALLESNIDDGTDDFMQGSFLDDDYALDDLSITLSGTRRDDGKSDDGDSSGSDDEKPYGCAIPECHFESSSPSLLFYHIKATHAGSTVSKPFRCAMPGCEGRKQYKNINGLQYHVTHAKNLPGHTGHGSCSQTSQLHSGNSKLSSSSASNSRNNIYLENSPEESPEQPQATSSFSHLTQPLHSSPLANSNSSPYSSPQSSTASAPGTRVSLHIPIPANTMGQTIGHLSNPPTPAEIQLQLHQARHDLVQPLSQPLGSSLSLHLTAQPISQPPPLAQSLSRHLNQPLSALSHSAYNISHSSMEISTGTSQSSSGSSSPHIQRPPFPCPELGCDQHFHHIGGLNSHMAIHHGHRAMTMRTNDPPPPFDSGAMVIPSNDFSDIDMNLASGSSSPMDTGMLNFDESLLHSQLDSLNHDHGHLGLDSSGTSLRGMTFNEMAFANHIANSLNNRVHFGTHINVSANDSPTLPPTPTTSANVSPRLMASTVTITQALPHKPSKTHKAALKKFPCTVAGCTKAYASSTTFNNHMRHDHPALYNTQNALGAPGIISAGLASTATAGVVSDASSLHGNNNSMDVEEIGTKADKAYKCKVPGCGRGYVNINGLMNHLLQAHGSTPTSSAS
ncbi:hypothetical protein BG004_004719 [Podila humilis]|nr:hypothetical protein BG004_004719 [Podila humilis]